MTRKILYGKIGRSMPLTLDKCGVAGGDQEMTAVVTSLALRHPDDMFILIGRNTGEDPRAVGLPANVFNPWHTLNPKIRQFINDTGMNHPNLTVSEHLKLNKFLLELTREHWETADAVVMWAGQHGTTNTPIPKVKHPHILTKPQDAFAFYAGYILRGINLWRDVDPWTREEVWLNADPRNWLKMRDLKWPLRHPVLSQYNFTNNIKHERYGDPGPDGSWEEWSATHDVSLQRPEDRYSVWSSHVKNVYSRLELNLTVPGTPSGNFMHFYAATGWNGKDHFGIIINEARAIGVKESLTRLTAMKEWVMPLQPKFIYGKWSDKSQNELGVTIEPCEWRRYTQLLPSVRTTFTTPSSGSGWATTKPWEAFALGVVCFFHPNYDTQNHILGDAPETLQRWLRVTSPQELLDRVRFLNQPENASVWQAIVNLQREHYEKAVANPRYLTMIEDRIYGEHL